MSQQGMTRFAIDLDDLERQLRQTASAQPKVPASDPLVELARIVGQDDPFKAVLGERRAAQATPLKLDLPQPDPERTGDAQRAEPNLDDLLNAIEAETAAEARRVSGEQKADAALDADIQPVRAASAPRSFEDDLRDELRPSLEPRHAVDLDAAGEPERHDADDAGQGRNPAAAERDAGEAAIEPMGAGGAPAGIVYAPPPPAEYPEPPAEPVDDMRALEPKQPRKGLVIAGALLGVAVLGVGSVIGMRGLGGGQTAGGVPVIRAESGPARVAPQNPGGVDIPNQNKEIYERTQTAAAQQTRVVTREEQPIDVQAMARATPRVIPLGQAQAPASTPVEPPASAAAPLPPPQTPPPAAASNGAAPVQPVPPGSLGEPRRVRTVSVRPDGTIAGAPSATGSTPAQQSQAAQPPAASSPAAPAQAGATPPPRPQATAPVVPRPPATQPPRPAAEEQRTAQVQPPRAQVAAAPATTPAPRATDAAPPPSGGGFMVQLGAPGSEAEARATFSSLQRRFSEQLGGVNPTIRRAELSGGRTVYRLRVGPFSRDEAAERCRAIQAAGGQCFVASN